VRKKLVVSVMLSLFLILLFSGSVFAMLPEDERLAKDLNIKDYNPDTPWLEVDPKLIFNKNKLTRTINIDGKEYKDFILIVYNSGTYKIGSLGEEYISYGKREYSKWASNFDEYIDFRLRDGFASTFGESYPYYEIVSINGVPWQETEYKDLIMEKIKEKAPKGRLKDNEEYWETLKDPRFNGLAVQIHHYKKSKEEVLQKALEYGNQTVKEKDISVEEKAVEESIIIENGAVLKIGSSSVKFYENKVQKDIVTMRVSPKVIEGHTVIPLRGVFDHFGAKLSYNGKTEEVTIEINNKEIVLKIGSNKAIVNGKEVKMDTKAIVKNGRTLIPLRFIGEQLGYKIKWIDKEQKIIIEK